MVRKVTIFLIGLAAVAVSAIVFAADFFFVVPVLTSIQLVGWWSIATIFVLRMIIGACILMLTKLPACIDPDAARARLEKSRMRWVLAKGAGWAALAAGILIGPISSHALLRTAKYPTRRLWKYTVAINLTAAIVATSFYKAIKDAFVVLVSALIA